MIAAVAQATEHPLPYWYLPSLRYVRGVPSGGPSLKSRRSDVLISDRGNVRFGSLADIGTRIGDVRSPP
jgi:hypothetical protein